jgi:hypothetical protein
MKLNTLIAALNSLQKSDTNNEVVTSTGEEITGVEFVENEVVICIGYDILPFDDEPEEEAPVKSKK